MASPRAFTDDGADEVMKGTVHVCAGLLFGVMAVYNGAAFAARRETHLLFNAALYGSLFGYEVTRVIGHWSEEC